MMNFSSMVCVPSAPKAAPIPLKSSNKHTTSARSQLAHWDEDWTSIADMTERRRIQNRIAQRNYRRRLKERLLRLEEQASKSEASSHAAKTARLDAKSSTQTSSPMPQHRSPPPDPVTSGYNSTTIIQKSDHSANSQQTVYASSVDSSTTSSDSFSSPWWYFGSQPTMLSYPEFSMLPEDTAYDYTDGNEWRRATWPHD